MGLKVKDLVDNIEKVLVGDLKPYLREPMAGNMPLPAETIFYPRRFERVMEEAERMMLRALKLKEDPDLGKLIQFSWEKSTSPNLLLFSVDFTSPEFLDPSDPFVWIRFNVAYFGPSVYTAIENIRKFRESARLIADIMGIPEGDEDRRATIRINIKEFSASLPDDIQQFKEDVFRIERIIQLAEERGRPCIVTYRDRARVNGDVLSLTLVPVVMGPGDLGLRLWINLEKSSDLVRPVLLNVSASDWKSFALGFAEEIERVLRDYVS